jgi:sulfide:quinone oxidoreductase
MSSAYPDRLDPLVAACEPSAESEPMPPSALSPNVSVAPQIAPGDVAGIAAHGFKSIICNRPDGEEANQPAWREIEAAARSAGLQGAHIPVSGKDFRPETVEAFAAALETLPKPILAYCRAGTRSAILWALSNNGALTADERIRTGARAGYDLEPYRERMERPA